MAYKPFVVNDIEDHLQLINHIPWKGLLHLIEKKKLWKNNKIKRKMFMKGILYAYTAQKEVFSTISVYFWKKKSFATHSLKFRYLCFFPWFIVFFILHKKIIPMKSSFSCHPFRIHTLKFITLLWMKINECSFTLEWEP